MLVEILDFNKKRNNFDLVLELEISMLKEEIQEFFDATTLAERIDAYVDTEYVFIGTKMKCAYNGYKINPDLVVWVDESLALMEEILNEMIGTGRLKNKIMNKARKIVADINALKVSELDENGKVKKQKDLPNATEEIAQMLEDYEV
jgi:hypothetical protein